MKILNLTAEDITVFDAAGKEVLMRVEASGDVAMVSGQTQIPVDTGELFPSGVVVVEATKFTSLSMPTIEDSVDAIIVSRQVGRFLREHHELANFFVLGQDARPDRVVWDANGDLIGTKGFICYMERSTGDVEVSDAEVSDADNKQSNEGDDGILTLAVQSESESSESSSDKKRKRGASNTQEE